MSPSGPDTIAEAAIAQISFRPIRADDRDFLTRLYASTREDELAQVPWSAEQKSAFLLMQFDAQDRFYRQSFTSARFDVIERGSEPIGRLYVDSRPDEIRLIDIALVPSERGQGLGTALLRALMEQARVAALPLTLHVEQFNPAARLYERLGFVERSIEGVHRLMRWDP